MAQKSVTETDRIAEVLEKRNAMMTAGQWYSTTELGGRFNRRDTLSQRLSGLFLSKRASRSVNPTPTDDDRATYVYGPANFPGAEMASETKYAKDKAKARKKAKEKRALNIDVKPKRMTVISKRWDREEGAAPKPVIASNEGTTIIVGELAITIKQGEIVIKPHAH